MTKTPRIPFALTTSVCLLASLTAPAQLPQHHDVSSLQPYTPAHHVSGMLRVYGNNYIPALMKRWQEGFQHFQPEVSFTTNLPGTEAAMAGITTGIADIAFIGREGYRSEINGFKGRWGYLPTGIEISSGSFGTPHKTFSLEIFVNKSNPLAGLTMDQARAIFSADTGIKTWGDVGLTGPIATHPIHIYGYQFDTGMAGYFNHIVLHDTGTWNPHLHDFDNGRDSHGEVINAGNYILKALADDPDGVAFANLQYTNDRIKPVGLALHPGSPYVQATPETIWDRTYPIHRFTTLYINREPRTPVPPIIAEFIRYILSREGMQAVADDNAYTPINEQVAQHERHKLDDDYLPSEVDALPQPVSQTTLRVWGSPAAKPLLLRWEAAYIHDHTAVRFTNTLNGPASAMAGLYNSVADLVLMGRELWPVDTMAYHWVFQHQPFGLAVVTAGLNAPAQAFTPVVVVAVSNPLSSITPAQLDAIYGSEHRAAPANARTWGDLGLTGDWAARPIHPVGFGPEDALGVYFRHDLLKADFKPNPDSTLLSDRDPGASTSAANRIARKVAADPNAIGYTSAAELPPTLKILPIDGIPPTEQTIQNRTYPLARTLSLYFNRVPEKPLDPALESFLRYILSPEGQSQVRAGEGFLPLTPSLSQQELNHLTQPMPPDRPPTPEL